MQKKLDFIDIIHKYDKMIKQINEHDIKFIGIEGYTVGFEKNGKKFYQNIHIWEQAIDPSIIEISEDDIIGLVVDAFIEN